MNDVLIIDAETNEQTQRPSTSNEIAQRQFMQAEHEARQAEQEAKVASRESALAKLAALGLTKEEVAAL